jgi:chorismate mutase
MNTMTKLEEPASSLDALRREIDGIDRSMHALLMERGEIIDRLIAVKARQGGGSAFRPAREAEMMRRLVTRHAGILPLDTVEGIWRIIISTFTYVQAPYSVHADISAADAPMRDSCRFHFGFTVPLSTHEGACAVIAAVAAADGDLGLVRAENVSTPWWDDLVPAGAPKIIARLPFVERADHAAGLPLYVVAKPLEDAALHDVVLHAIHLPGPATAPALPAPAAILNAAATPTGLSLLVATPEDCSIETLETFFAGAGHPAPRIAFIGSHAARFEVEAERRLAAQ